MCMREMTLGEEILNLTKIGVDIQTVERIYRKYIQFSMIKEPNQADNLDALRWPPDFIIKSNSVHPGIVIVGDKIEIPLDNLGTFTATAQMIIDHEVLFLFDDYIVKRPMNKNGSNEGGYEKSDLKKWIDNDLFKMFPEALRRRIIGMTIPTLGEICGWDNKWDKEHIWSDGDEQLPLMKQRKNRVAYFQNEPCRGWLRNAVTKEVSSVDFSVVNFSGYADYDYASVSYGVRPEFWLIMM